MVRVTSRIWRSQDSPAHVVAGHVLGLAVGRGSFVITITVHPYGLQRALEPAIGAKVLQLDHV